MFLMMEMAKKNIFSYIYIYIYTCVSHKVTYGGLVSFLIARHKGFVLFLL